MFFKNKSIFIVLMLLLFFGCLKNSENSKIDKELLMLDSIAGFYHEGDFDNSIKLGKRFIIDFPNNDKGWTLLSSCYLARDIDSMAVICVDKALQINPFNNGALTNKGILFDKAEKYDDATKYYEKALMINANLAQTYSNYMKNRIRVSDYAYAVDLGENALKFGNNIWDKANLCFAYYKIGEIAKRDSLLIELQKLKFNNLQSLEAAMFKKSD